MVDITTTGATLRANGLKILSDGVILKSQAQLAASLKTAWTAGQLGSVRRLLGVVEAWARARRLSLMAWPPEQSVRAEAATEPFLARGASRQANGLLAQTSDLFDIAAALSAEGVGPVSVTRPEFAFEPASPAADALEARLKP